MVVDVDEVIVRNGFVQIYTITNFSYNDTINYWDKGVNIANYVCEFVSSFTFVSFSFT